MKQLPVSILTLSVVLAACQSKAPVPNAASLSAPVAVASVERCEALAGSRLGDATIESARPMQRGTQLLGFFKRTMIKTFVLPGLPDLRVPADFCQVTAKLRPVADSAITVELWLPRQWNGKMLGTGGGGFSGGLLAAKFTLRGPVGKGYAAMATDVGHPATGSAKFTHDSRQQYVDYAYQGNHVAAEFAKSLIAAYYGTPPRRAYFHGCSNGGRDALMEARRFPEDYDGIISGAPAAGWAGLMTSFAWNSQAIAGAPGLKKKFKLAGDAAIARCDALDGVKDGLIENPQNCRFDPAELQCAKGDGAGCLNADEVAALRKIYGGPRLRDGTAIYAGMPPGGEGLKSNWEQWIGDRGTQATFARETYRWMVYRDPQWDLDRFDIDRHYPKAREALVPLMNSDDPDLGAFTRRGGKLMLYHGWNDGAIPAGATVDYHAALRKALGPVADAQTRLFMIPGLMHCGGGSGVTDFDLLDQIDRWVESGVAPERIVATQYDPPALFGPAPDAKLVRTRPLCPWPKTAHYDGHGSTDDAASFSCR